MKSLLIGVSSLAFAWIAAVPGLALAADAESPAALAAPASTTVYDPFEPANRALFKFNKSLDRAIIRPVALGYKRTLPPTVRKGIGNFLDNLGEPVTFINDVLQLRPRRATTTVGRFLLNSTVGVGGLVDVAGIEGTPIHYSDFGQTLGRYGVRPGPYIYVPVFGPSDLRDGTGRIVDGFASPLNIHDLHVPVSVRVGLVVLNGVNTRAEYDDALQELARTATDEYASQRAVYMQNRQSEITAQDTAVQQLPDFDTPPAAAGTSPKL